VKAFIHRLLGRKDEVLVDPFTANGRRYDEPVAGINSRGQAVNAAGFVLDPLAEPFECDVVCGMNADQLGQFERVCSDGTVLVRMADAPYESDRLYWHPAEVKVIDRDQSMDVLAEIEQARRLRVAA
jgi:hypothetical protein